MQPPTYTTCPHALCHLSSLIACPSKVWFEQSIAKIITQRLAIAHYY